MPASADIASAKGPFITLAGTSRPQSSTLVRPTAAGTLAHDRATRAARSSSTSVSAS